MAVRSYDQTLDTMVTTALDTMSKDPANLLSDSGEKFLKAAASKGRLFVVNDAENIRHPVLFDHGEDSTYYAPDHIGTTGNLGNQATELLTSALFTMQAGTRNINFPQSQPAGNLIDYVSSVVKANMMKILNEEECLFVRGESSGSGTEASISPFSADNNFGSTRQPMSLGALMIDGAVTGAADTRFANLRCDVIDVSGDANTKWKPTHIDAAQVTGTKTIMSDMQEAILTASFSEAERPTDVYCSLTFFDFFLQQMREKGALPDPVQANLGKEGAIPFAGVNIDWSRYLSKDVLWDTDAASTTAQEPVFGINWNSLRLNVVRAGGVGSDSLGFIQTLAPVIPHPTTTTVFKRIEWKRQWSVDKGRRSFFGINDLTGTLTVS